MSQRAIEVSLAVRDRSIEGAPVYIAGQTVHLACDNVTSIQELTSNTSIVHCLGITHVVLKPHDELAAMVWGEVFADTERLDIGFEQQLDPKHSVQRIPINQATNRQLAQYASIALGLKVEDPEEPGNRTRMIEIINAPHIWAVVAL